MSLFWIAAALLALFHAPGLRRLTGPASHDRAAVALSLALLLPGVMHFTNPEPFVAMMPDWLGWHAELVWLSGVAELVVALGLLIPATRRVAGWAGVALFIAIWPANVHIALAGEAPAAFQQPAWQLWLRVPFQVLYIGWAAWVALGHIPGRAFRQRMFATLYDRAQARYDEYIGERKRALIGDLRGTVLEVGPGTGVNFAYLDPSVRWIGIEPNPHMRKRLAVKARAAGIEPEFRGFEGTRLEVEDHSVDVVLSTLVQCSVPDPAEFLREVQRVLVPGGRFVFIEHVAAPRDTLLRRVQNFLVPVWAFMADGCCPNRETAELLRAAGFASLELEEFRVPPAAIVRVVSPHIAGVATT